MTGDEAPPSSRWNLASKALPVVAAGYPPKGNRHPHHRLDWREKTYQTVDPLEVGVDLQLDEEFWRD